jgi:hypothetical protein
VRLVTNRGAFNEIKFQYIMLWYYFDIFLAEYYFGNFCFCQEVTYGYVLVHPCAGS